MLTVIIILFLIGSVCLLCAEKDWHIYTAGLCFILCFCLFIGLILGGDDETVEAKQTAVPQVEETEEQEVPGLRFGPHFNLRDCQYKFYGWYIGNNLYGWDFEWDWV